MSAFVLNEFPPFFQLVALFVRYSERTYDLVFGQDIEEICTLYVGENEYFSKEHKGKRVKIEETDCICSLSRNGGSSVYGNIRISNAFGANKYKWTFKIKDKKQNMFIGIDSNPKFTECDFSNYHRALGTCPNDIFCAYGSDGNLYGYFSPIADEYGVVWNDGDIIEMIVDVDDETLRYCVNGIDQGIALNNLKFDTYSYRMGIALFFESDCIELIDFCICSKQKIESDEKEDICEENDAEILIERFGVKQIKNKCEYEWKSKWVIIKGNCLWIEEYFDELHKESSLIIKHAFTKSDSETQFVIIAEDRKTNDIIHHVIEATTKQQTTVWLTTLSMILILRSFFLVNLDNEVGILSLNGI